MRHEDQTLEVDDAETVTRKTHSHVPHRDSKTDIRGKLVGNRPYTGEGFFWWPGRQPEHFDGQDESFFIADADICLVRDQNQIEAG